MTLSPCCCPRIRRPRYSGQHSTRVGFGFIFTMIGSGTNQFFSLRYLSVHIIALAAELLAYPFGVFLAKTLPICTIDLGCLGKWCIDPDRHFNIKEHTVIAIMSNISFGYRSANSTQINQAGKVFYGFDLESGFSTLIVLCCQLLGFGVASLSSRWLVASFDHLTWSVVKLRAAVYIAFTFKRNCQWIEGQSTPILHVYYGGSRRLVLLSGSHICCVVVLYLGLLDCSKESYH